MRIPSTSVSELIEAFKGAFASYSNVSRSSGGVESVGVGAGTVAVGGDGVGSSTVEVASGVLDPQAVKSKMSSAKQQLEVFMA